MTPQDQAAAETLAAASTMGISTILFRNTLAKAMNLTLTESLCLTMLGVMGPLPPSVLARLTGLTSGATTTLLDRLQTRGFIRRAPHPEDRRSIQIHLTDTHSDQAKALVGPVQKAHQELLGRYSPEELRLITGFLRGFSANLARNSEDVGLLGNTIES